MQRFFEYIHQAIDDASFVKITFSKPRNSIDELRNVYAKPVIIKDKRLFSFTYRYEKRDETKNYDVEQTIKEFRSLLENVFFNASLFTLTNDISLMVSKKGKVSLISKSIQGERVVDNEHDHSKNRLIDISNPWWFKLGFTTREGKVLADWQHKYKQISKYVEIVAAILKPFKDKSLNIVDMGAGKGYLTFALYEYLMANGFAVDMRGVEIRADLVKKINGIIGECGLSHFQFVESSIEDYRESFNVMIALHACNTATDDAIAKAIDAHADLIISAPCCHKEVRREMESSGLVDPMTQYGIFLERQAAMITDTLRALIMEYHGYKTQIMEFIEMEHTPKNILLVGQRSDSVRPKERVMQDIKELMTRYGIKHQKLLDNVELRIKN